jgi:cytochrome c oxidase assembly factor CtaG
VWHAPYLYDLTLRSQLVHDTEHFLFLASGVLLWAQLADSPPLHARLGDIGRGLLAFATIFSSWVLALVFVYWPSPLYSAYANLPSRPGGISALTDQQLAAGMMLVPGSLPLSIAVFVFIYRLLADDRGPDAPRRRRFSTPRLEQKGV